MLKRTIARIGTETSALGMGCWAIGGEWNFLGGSAGWGKTDDKESILAIQTAFEQPSPWITLLVQRLFKRLGPSQK